MDIRTIIEKALSESTGFSFGRPRVAPSELLPPHLVQSLSDNPFSSNPIFSCTDGLDSITSMLNKRGEELRGLVPGEVSDLRKELRELLLKVKELEAPILERLEQIAIEYVAEVFDLYHDEGWDISLSIVEAIGLPAETVALQEPSYEFEDCNRIEQYQQEVHKRSVVNALNDGCCRRVLGSFTPHIESLYALNPELIPLYKRIADINQILDFFSEPATDSTSVTEGATSSITSIDGGYQITVTAINFPALLEESVRAIVEAKSYVSLPEDDGLRGYVLQNAKDSTGWCSRIGAGLWDMVAELSDDCDGAMATYETLLGCSTEDFFGALKEVCSGTKRGKELVGTFKENGLKGRKMRVLERGLRVKRGETVEPNTADYFSMDELL